MRISSTPLAGQGSPGMPWGWKPGPRAWQHLHQVGTELVHLSQPPSPTATGSAVVASGAESYSVQYRARLDPMWMVRVLTVTVTQAGTSRSIRLHRGPRDHWTMRDDDATPGQIPPHPEGPDRPDIVWLSGSPVFLGWAVRALALLPSQPAQLVPVIHIDPPSLTLRRSVCSFQLLAAGRLHVTGNGSAFTCYLDRDGVVATRPGRTRLVTAH